MTGNHQAIVRLGRRVHSYGAARALVAFSGGVDSAVVLAVAAHALGADAVTGAADVTHQLLFEGHRTYLFDRGQTMTKTSPATQPEIARLWAELEW